MPACAEELSLVFRPSKTRARRGAGHGNEAFESAGDVIRIVPGGRKLRSALSSEERLRLFDEATDRLHRRAARLSVPDEAPDDRGWRRDELYQRGKPR